MWNSRQRCFVVSGCLWPTFLIEKILTFISGRLLDELLDGIDSKLSNFGTRTTRASVVPLWCLSTLFHSPFLHFSFVVYQGSTIAAVTRTRIRLINFLWSGQQLQWTPYIRKRNNWINEWSPMSVIKPSIKTSTFIILERISMNDRCPSNAYLLKVSIYLYLKQNTRHMTKFVRIHEEHTPSLMSGTHTYIINILIRDTWWKGETRYLFM